MTTFDAQPAAESTTSRQPLGPATVLHVRGRTLRVRRDGDEFSADVAVGYAYDPAEGDEVLVIGEPVAAYVIGVLHARNPHKWAVEGNLVLHARGGSIQMQADDEFTVTSNRISLRTLVFDLAADRARESYRRVTQWVGELFTLQAARSETIVKEEAKLVAGRINQRAEEDVNIDGKKINLG
ncbi:MAG: DUF3540 domain-containing protein [Puniceicoccales bacterium]